MTFASDRRPTAIAVALTRADPPLAQQVDAAVAGGAHLIELRVDQIGDADAVAELLRAPHAVPFILTIRGAAEGGHWDGHDADRIALLERLGLLLPGYVDVEYETWTRSANVRQKIGLVCDDSGARGQRAAAVVASSPEATARARNALILSKHDWQETPADLEPTLRELDATPASVRKAVFRAHDASDALRVLVALARRAARGDWILLAMGEAGAATRVLAGKFGGFLTFAALDPRHASAPGQLSLEELTRCYHAPRIGPATRVFGIVGWPVTHSHSPRIHNAALAADGLDAVYLPLPVDATASAFHRFMDLLVAHPELDVHGLSVTIPHKEHALEWLVGRGGSISAAARACGSVNTLTRSADGGWSGDNTDGRGALRALATALRETADRAQAAPVPVAARDTRAEFAALRERRVDVLGAGGAARGVVGALLDAGAAVTVFNRNAARAELLAQELGCAWQPWERRGDGDGDVVINCTPVGMWPRVDDCPLPVERLARQPLVFDTVYRPADTRLLRSAREHGCATLLGAEMLLHQADLQYQQWHARPAPLEVMRAALPRT
ncbi:MAG: type I 3-dehydroquinate dehydratase [Phycisphaerae bacterium]